MSRAPMLATAAATAMAAIAFAWAATTPRAAAAPPAADRVFELRTYVANEGKAEAMHTRFRDHTCKLFKKHGMELVGFWTPQDVDKGKADTLVYILAFPSRDAAKQAWAAFGADPEWQSARDESEKGGKLVKAVTSVYLDPTDYSPAK